MKNKYVFILTITVVCSFLLSLAAEGLRELYSNCSFIIFPSPFENFAYSLVEAMSCGAAITCSNTTAMPETCQDAALYFDPYNIDEMVEKIVLLILNGKIRKRLKQKALERASELPDYKDVTLQTLDIMKNLTLNYLKSEDEN